MPHSRRQQVGLACEECRRRKARCDRLRPSCGFCKDADVTCHYVDKRPQRGPRKGQMDALKNLVANLEQKLGERREKGQHDHGVLSPDAFAKPEAVTESIAIFENQTTLADTLPMTLAADWQGENQDAAAFENIALENDACSSPSLEESLFALSGFIGNEMRSLGGIGENSNFLISDQNSNSDWLDGKSPLSPPSSSSDTRPFNFPEDVHSNEQSELSDLVQADLDELYFDRVHPIAPNIHKGNYFAWSRQDTVTASQKALRYAMRAVAAALSAQYHSLSGTLCTESRRLLEQMDVNNAGGCNDTPIEQIQAWLLVAHYELLCKDERQAMLTAGRAIRMVQLARLDEMDACNRSFLSFAADTPLFTESPLPVERSFSETEARRRTFWLAYCYDRFCLMRSECPPSLREDTISTRLPAPEVNFRNNQPIQMDFLPEAISQSGRIVLPPFAECVVLNSLFSRCLSHRRLALSAPVPGKNDTQKFWSKHTWLALPLEKRKQSLARSLTEATTYIDDPMLIFAHALAACAIIYVYQSMAQSMAWSTVERESDTPSYEEQSYQVMGELVRIVETTRCSLSQFKAHPFLPTVIHRAAIFLIGFSTSPTPPSCGYVNLDKDLNTLIGVLGDLQQVNVSSRNSLRVLEKNLLCST